MNDIFSASFVILVISFLIFTFLKREYKRRILNKYRAFIGETKDGFLARNVNLYFPIPYESSNPEFYKNHDIQLLVKKVNKLRLAQLISVVLIIIWIVIEIN